MAPNKSELSYLYRSECEPKVKERLLLVLKVKGNGVIPARAAKELDRSRTWSTNWLMRYDQEGVHGLKNKPRSGRPPKLSPKIAFEIVYGYQRRHLNSWFWKNAGTYQGATSWYLHTVSHSKNLQNRSTGYFRTKHFEPEYEKLSNWKYVSILMLIGIEMFAESC